MPKPESAPRTLYDKLWESHVVSDLGDGRALVYVDRQLLHEVSTPIAFSRIDAAGRSLRRSETCLAVPDHAVPTTDRDKPIANTLARAQVARLEENARRHGVAFLPLSDPRQGIVHVIAPEQGFTLPGTTLVCGDSHTSTHGAFGALAFGIGASECAIAMTTQCLVQKRSKTMRIWLPLLPNDVTAKDVALAIIARIGANGAAGHAVELAGPGVIALSMEARMTLCNMVIEMGARMGLIAPDEVTFTYLADRPMVPKGALWQKAVEYWQSLSSDEGSHFDAEYEFDTENLVPHVTWGTSPEDAVPITGAVPVPAQATGSAQRDRWAAACAYMGLAPGMRMTDISVDRVFIGSCTNGRIEDLRLAAGILKDRKIADTTRLIVVPGSGHVKARAEAEGLADVFRAAGAEWRDAGCSLCVAMNGDQLAPDERCASTSNRNFEGRQGPGGRTHLVSPATAAATAIRGHLADPRKLEQPA